MYIIDPVYLSVYPFSLTIPCKGFLEATPMIEMKVAGIAIDATNRSPIVLLKTVRTDGRCRFI